MKNNIFENAYFGKEYKTKDGRKALYLNYCSSTKYHELITDDLQDIECDDYGFFIEDDIDNNIVSEWEEEINEEEFDKLALRYTPIELRYKGYSIDELMILSFKAGYRKALNNNRI